MSGPIVAKGDNSGASERGPRGRLCRAFRYALFVSASAISPDRSSGPSASGRIAAVLGFAEGTWMLVEGMHRLIAGAYPAVSGVDRWQRMLIARGINPQRMAPLLVLLGALWLTVGNLYLFQNRRPAWIGLLVLALTSLLYAMVGTAIAIVICALLLAPTTQRALSAVRR
jgi:hypothetical protein